MPDSLTSSAGRRPLRHRLLPSWIKRYFSRGRASSSAPIARSAIASSTSASGDDADVPQPHPQPSSFAAIATPPPTSPSPGLRAQLSISKLYCRLSRSLAPSSRGSPPSPVRSASPQPVSDALQVLPSSSSADVTDPIPPTGSLIPLLTTTALEVTAPSTDVEDAIVHISTAPKGAADAPAADPMARMWSEAVAEWQRKAGVDLNAPEA
ncbi:hypothetical protein EV715DRAFT_173404, partial [Schizophyllum commune]